MELIRGIHNLRPALRGCVATIGSYDGVHLGHRQVLERLVATGRELGEPSLVMSFEPTPREYFARGPAAPRLTSLREKLAALEDCGVERFLCLRFDARLAGMSARQFIERLLVEGLGVRHLVVGDDFRFGRQREGDFATLVDSGREHGFAVQDTPSYEVDGRRVSSTAIREALAAGRLDEAARMLGRRYTMIGRVARGEQLGRRLGYPTANIRLGDRVPPLAGVFAVRAHCLGPVRHGVASLGTRPTVDGRELLLEVHLFDFDEQIYGRRIEVEFVASLREERRFDSVEALTAQMRQDASRAREILAALEDE